MARNDDIGRKDASKPTPRKASRAGDEATDPVGGQPQGQQRKEAPASAKEKAAAEKRSDDAHRTPADDREDAAPKGAHAKHAEPAERLGKEAQGRMVPAGTAAKGAEGKPIDLPAKNAKRKRAFGVAAALVAVALAVGIGVFATMGGNGEPGDALVVDGTSLEVNDIADDGKLVNPIDWEEWIARNSDVYAWLVVPDTKVDLPILQHPVIDDYYLTHDIDGNPLIDGALYTQINYNSKDLTSDKVTVVYGHTFTDNDAMFTTLHNFEDLAFFEEHPTFYVYTPTDRLEYEVVSAFDYDNRHILETQNMSDPAVVEEFFAMVQNPSTMNGNSRALEQALSSTDDHLLVLSTCTQPANDSQRFLVVAVLRDVQPTQDKTAEWVDPNLEIKDITDEDVA